MSFINAAVKNVPQNRYKNVMMASKYWPCDKKLTVCAAATKDMKTESTRSMNLNIGMCSVDRDSWCVTQCVTHV